MQKDDRRVQRIRPKARLARFRRKKERLFRQRTAWILLRKDFKLRLCVRKILTAIISLRQLHPNIRGEGGACVLLEKTTCQPNDFGVVAFSRVFDPDRKIIASLSGCCSRLGLSRMREIFPRFIQTRGRDMESELGQSDPCL